MYMPSIGLFKIMVAWSVNHWLISRPREADAVVLAASLLACALATRQQMVYWRDSIALFTRILSLTKDCDMAHNGLGIALSSAGRREQAIYHFKETLRINPASVKARYNLGIELAGAGGWMKP